MNKSTPVDAGILKRLIAPPNLNWADFAKLAAGAFVEELPPGSVLFREGSSDSNIVYLLEGEVALATFSGGQQGTLRGGSLESRWPVAEAQPRAETGRAVTQVSVVQLDRARAESLGSMLDHSQIEVSEVLEWGAEDNPEEADKDRADADWMLRLLHLPAFVHLPSVSIQALYTRLETMSVQAGQVIIEQGAPGTAYFIIMRGECTVSRTNALGGNVVLAKLSYGDAFGEQSLVSGEPRVATVTMDSDGQLLKLSKPDFEVLIKQHMLREVTFADAAHMARAGARYLDVRPRKEYDTGHVADSDNVPLFLLRLKRKVLDPDATYMCYCNDGRTSAVATFLLREWGFDAYLIAGGLLEQSLQGSGEAQGLAVG